MSTERRRAPRYQFVAQGEVLENGLGMRAKVFVFEGLGMGVAFTRIEEDQLLSKNGLRSWRAAASLV